MKTSILAQNLVSVILAAFPSVWDGYLRRCEDRREFFTSREVDMPGFFSAVALAATVISWL